MPSPSPSISPGHRKEQGATGRSGRLKRQSQKVRGTTFCGIPNAETLSEPELNGSVEAPPRKYYHVFSVFISNFLRAIDSKRSPGRASNQSQLVMHPVPGPSSKALEIVIAEAVSDIAEKPYSYSFRE